MYLYESCTGSLYTSNEELDYYDLQCGTCGDSDSFIGEFNSKKELVRLLRNEGRNKEYVDEFIDEVYLK